MIARAIVPTLFLLAFCNALLAKLWVAPFWSISGLLLFLALVLALIYAAPRALVLLAPILLLWASELLSGTLIEHGAYLAEVEQRGTATGGFAVLPAIYMGFAIMMAIWIEAVLKHWAVDRYFTSFRTGQWILVAVTAFFTLTSGYAVLVGIREGFPLLSGADRLAFRAALADPLFEAWHSNRVLLAFFIGMIAAGGYRAVGLALLFGLAVVSLLFGEKFTSLVLIICAFLMVPGLVIIARQGRLKLGRVLLPILAIASITVPAIFAVYGGFERAPQAVGKMEDRFAAQAQAWYLAEKGVIRPDLQRGTIFATDARSWFDISGQNPKAAGTRFGHYLVMKEIAPYAVFDDFYTNNVGFVFLLFAYLYLLGGLWAVCFGGLLLCLLSATVLALIALAASRRDYMSVLIAGKLFVWHIAGFLLGYLWFFVGIKSLALLTAVALARVAHSRWTQPDRRLA